LKILKLLKLLLGLFDKYKPTYNADGLTTLHNNGFMFEPAFIKAEAAGAKTKSWENIKWRVHTILWAANQCKNLEGDFIECGTNKGGFARAICEYLDFKNINKKFFLLDTFEGLDKTLYTKEELAAGKEAYFDTAYENCYEQVVKTFSAFENIKIIKGTVPDTLEQVTCTKVAFMSIDMNSVVPEIAALDFFWDKLSKGAIVVLDDYAYVTYDLQYEAHNNWATQKGIKILSLPTGQGLIIK
jgi:O-methyltransferase